MLTLALVALAAAPVTAPAKRPVVTVLYFDNLTGLPGYDVLQKGLADMMVTDLVASEAVDVVERERFQAVVAELKLQRSRYFDPATAQQLGKAVGASHAVTGTIMAVEPAVRLSVRVWLVVRVQLIVRKVADRAAGQVEVVKAVADLVQQREDGGAQRPERQERPGRHEPPSLRPTPPHTHLL